MAGKYVELGLVFGDTLSEARAAHLETMAGLARGRERALGGLADVAETSTTYVDVPGAQVVLLDDDANVKIHAMGSVDAGTGYLRLVTVPGGVEVAGSEDTFTDTTPTNQVGSELVLPAGSYKLQVKAGAAPNHVLVYGAKMVTE